jgi:chaperonin GroES
MIKALDNRVIVLPDKRKTEIMPGIKLPETAQKQPHRGIVVAIGATVEEIKVDDYALYGEYSGTDVEFEGVVYRVLEKRDITCYDDKK